MGWVPQKEPIPFLRFPYCPQKIFLLPAIASMGKGWAKGKSAGRKAAKKGTAQPDGTDGCAKKHWWVYGDFSVTGHRNPCAGRKAGQCVRNAEPFPFPQIQHPTKKHCLWQQVSSATGNVQIFLTPMMGRIGFGPFTDSSQKTPARLRLRHPRPRRRLG